MNNQQLESRPLMQVSASTYMSKVLVDAMKSHAWWMFGLLALAMVLALNFDDVRYLLIAAMMLFVVLPMLSYYFYVKYCLHPQARYSILPKYVELDEANQLLKLELTDEEGVIVESVSFQLGEFRSVEISRNHVSIRFNRPGFYFLILPLSAFTLQQQVYLENKIAKECVDF